MRTYLFVGINELVSDSDLADAACTDVAFLGRCMTSEV